ncbi:MAG TPA: hypothetical protein DHW71_00805 [Gammaproteobacteria bacterium]|nr:hypothetical protein [Gammaproteobacteria bacterium]MEC8010898.1 sigma-E factor negative regulatory protein [Pseudomonadota bacterium]HBF06795.1 hypothetical protein [Gammaproteobacteria bacterium]HCK91488.1 hypothetical protein [Gammaproteobacteria bacterium]|tara:strand:- start:21837 stop:22622 length:786 start_codon:yes stop_codon:yes gene_type:complete
MTGNQFNVSQEDLQLLSAMLDGEISDQELDHLLDRMAHEPALGQAWSRLSQIQAATHHQAQAGLDIDLSQGIAAKLAKEEIEQTPTPVIPFPEKFAQQEQKSNSNVHQFDLSAKLKAQLSPDAEKKQASVAHAVSQVIEKSSPAKVSKLKGKSFGKQLLAHIAVAASVASITVWVQSDFMNTEQQLVQQETQVEANPATGVLPASIVANGVQDEPKATFETVGNKPSQLRVDWSVGDSNFDIIGTQQLTRNHNIMKASAEQ